MANSREMTISNWLKTQLQRKGMTPADFAEKYQIVTRSAMYYYVSGDRLPSQEVADQIGKALGSPVPKFTPRPVGRPKKKRFTRNGLFREVIGNIDSAKRA